jgi:hypothetical protein
MSAYRRIVISCALVLVALGGPAREASAQAATDVQRAIEVTQGVIDRASAQLSCPPGEQKLACVYLNQAVTLEASARGSYGSGFYRDALALTLRARDRAYSAIRLGSDATGGEFVRFSIERTDALLDRVAPPVRESGMESALRLLDVAFDAQRRAKQAAQDGRPRVATTATYQARERALRALKLADGARAVTPDRASAILQRTDDLIRVGAWLAEGGASSGHYHRAVSLETRARTRLDAGDSRRAIELSFESRDALSTGFARADHPVKGAAVERELTANGAALDLARTKVGDDPERKKRFDRAEDHQRRAQEHFGAGRFAAALAELRASKDELGRL